MQVIGAACRRLALTLAASLHRALSMCVAIAWTSHCGGGIATAIAQKGGRHLQAALPALPILQTLPVNMRTRCSGCSLNRQSLPSNDLAVCLRSSMSLLRLLMFPFLHSTPGLLSAHTGLMHGFDICDICAASIESCHCEGCNRWMGYKGLLVSLQVCTRWTEQRVDTIKV